MERNNHGHAVLAHLTMSQGYTNVYKSGGQAGLADDGGVASADAGELRRDPGGGAVHVSESAAAGGMPDVHTTYGWARVRRRRGAHDDTVMAMAIAQVVRAELRVRPPRSAHELNLAMLEAG